MIIKWIQSVLGQKDGDMLAPDSVASRPISNQNNQLQDITTEAFRDDSETLNEMVRLGYPQLRKRDLRRRVRAKVQQVIEPAFDDPEIVEEVTEKIVNAAEIDPYYAALFADKKKIIG